MLEGSVQFPADREVSMTFLSGVFEMIEKCNFLGSVHKSTGIKSNANMYCHVTSNANVSCLLMAPRDQGSMKQTPIVKSAVIYNN